MSSRLKIPPLRPHDRLTRTEFERRFDATPGLKKAELLRGSVYVAEPVNHELHGRPHTILTGWLSAYVEFTHGVDMGDNSSIRLDDDNMPQPDLLLRIARGGRSTVDADGYVAGPPELVVEVTASRVSYDLHDKLDVYRSFGVQEYVVHRAEDGELDWFALRGGRYVRRRPDRGGIIRSRVFPGLWLDVSALLQGDRAAIRAAVERGVGTEAHAAFTRRLAEPN